MTTHTITILYAPKPWDRGLLRTRTVEVPVGYGTAAKAERWLWSVGLIKNGEKIVDSTLEAKND